MPAGRPILALEQVRAYGNLPAGVPIVIVLDAMMADQLPEGLDKCPLLVTGQPHTRRFEQLRMEGRARHCFSYDESRERLRDFLPLLEEIAERGAALDLFAEKTRRRESSRPPMPVMAPAASSSPEIWDFLEGAVENLASRERLLSEFRRASRHLLRASHTVFFLRDKSVFRADRGSSHCPVTDPLVTYLSTHPVVLDGVEWPAPSDPLAEMGIRNRMAMWGARLLVPLHDNGHLTGIIACGVRDDGQPYNESDKARAISVARLLRQLVNQNQHYSRLERLYEDVIIGDRYLPSRIVLSPEQEPPRHVPLVVRSLVGKVRHTRETEILRASAGQPFRASAGIVAETGGVWATWEEASSEIDDSLHANREDRLNLLRELALTLNHEVGNSLVSLSMLRQSYNSGEAIPERLRTTVDQDIARLETLNRDLVHLGSLRELSCECVDLCAMLKDLGELLGLKVELPPDPVRLQVVPTLVEFALQALARTVLENQPADPARALTIQLRSTGEEEETIALLSLQGAGLELEGILPDSVEEETPNQGRLTVFIAKEVIRLHGGEIHAGPGLEGTEILVSLRHW